MANLLFRNFELRTQPAKLSPPLKEELSIQSCGVTTDTIRDEDSFQFWQMKGIMCDGLCIKAPWLDLSKHFPSEFISSF